VFQSTARENFLKSVISSKAAAFIEDVLALRAGFAVFDCDGTLWAGDSGEGFFDWELKRRLVSDEVIRWARPRYADYRAGNVSEDAMCGEMVTMHRGLSEAVVEEAAGEFFEEKFATAIFPEMQELVERLRGQGCDVWVVSSTSEWVIRAAMKNFGIPADHVLAAAVEIEKGVVTDRLVRVPSGGGKPAAIREVVGKIADAAFGNSRWDTEMLEMAKHAFAVNPNPDLEAAAKRLGWTIYWPEAVKSVTD